MHATGSPGAEGHQDSGGAHPDPRLGRRHERPQRVEVEEPRDRLSEREGIDHGNEDGDVNGIPRGAPGARWAAADHDRPGAMQPIAVLACAHHDSKSST
ncbi:MAG: hypothetical protein IPN45_04315 [Actinomycetales bacterium]|nr:hypothetical protein [Actinomycetales bacterium]